MPQSRNPRVLNDAQRAANRRNAQKSTGPRTPQGKAASSRNRLSHGLTAKKHLILDEDPAEFQELLADLRARFRPVGSSEDKLVYRIAVNQWNLDRAPAMEAAIFRDCIRDLDYGDADRQTEYEAEVKQAAYRGDPPPPPPYRNDPRDLAGLAFTVDCDTSHAFATLARYTTTMECSIARCLRTLQLYQAARKQAEPPSPAPPPVPTPSKHKDCETKPTTDANPPVPLVCITPQTPAPAPQPSPCPVYPTPYPNRDVQKPT